MSPEGGLASGKQILFLYKDGATIQLHQPQQHIPQLAEVVRDLEATFGAVVGVNSYLTPPNAQGLAPHSDDICAFALQTYGEKTWCLHELSEQDRLPIVESRDLGPDDLPPKSVEVTLTKGDLLYFPKGCVHYATTSNHHSVHLTVSTYQNWSWSVFMNSAIQRALELATSKELALRNPLPLNFLEYMGSGRGPVVNVKAKQEQFTKEMMEVFSKVSAKLPEAMHSAADEMGMEFTSHRLPPEHSDDSPENLQLLPETKVRFSDPTCFQIIECWQYEEEDASEMPPQMMAFLPPNNSALPDEAEVANIEDSEPQHEKTSEDETNLPDPYAPEAPGEHEPEPLHFWLFDSHCNNQDTHMMVSDISENPPLQIDDIFRPLIMHLIASWEKPPATLQQLSDDFDIELDCVKELFEHLIMKRIAMISI